MTNNTEKYECLGSFMQNNIEGIRSNPEMLSDRATCMFNIEDAGKRQMIQNFFKKLAEEKSCPPELNNPLGRIIEIPKYKTKVAVHESYIQPKCPKEDCNGVGFWNFGLCPKCHENMPDLAELHSYISDNLYTFIEQNNIPTKEVLVTGATTGKVIVRDDDVIVTDRDIEAVKKDIHKYMPR